MSPNERLSEAAQSAGLPQVELGTREQADLDWILRCNPGLTEELDLTVAYRAPRRGTWLPTFPIDAGKSEPVIVLTEPKPYRGHWTLSQRTTSDVEVGGFTLLSRRT